MGLIDDELKRQRARMNDHDQERSRVKVTSRAAVEDFVDRMRKLNIRPTSIGTLYPTYERKLLLKTRTYQYLESHKAWVLRAFSHSGEPDGMEVSEDGRLIRVRELRSALSQDMVWSVRPPFADRSERYPTRGIPSSGSLARISESAPAGQSSPSYSELDSDYELELMVSSMALFLERHS